ncbi:hypothetical protein E3E31_00265 [Thermococcus sp. M39]|uniref:hypothetical protein n=1 Tax=Thermococcus sp. M39 TaxID=1638262 RepID=UPI00143A47F2|nr:hypothetical protein [Thermococcus sp. M39]NJE06991.1 hypothetical protein [Thermococcus sp. M39]
MVNKTKSIIPIGLIGFMLGAVVGLVSLRHFIFSKGLAIWQDLHWVYHSQLYSKYLWDEYTQTFIIPNHLIGKYWLYLFPPELSERLLFIVLFGISGFSMFYTMYKLTDDFIASLISTIFFVINPVVAIRLGHWLLLWYYSFLPILFYSSLRAFNEVSRLDSLFISKILKISLPISLILFLMSPSVRLPYYFPIIFLAFVICLSQPYKENLKKFTFLVLMIGLLYIFLSLVWLLPLIFAKSLTPSNYVVTSEVLRMLSRNSGILKVITLQSFWADNWFREIFNISGVFYTTWILVLCNISCLVFLSLLIYRKEELRELKENAKLILVLTSYLLVLIFLAKGTQPPFGEFYEWLIFKSPILSKFGWQFRGPNKWNLLIMFIYSLLIGLTINTVNIILDKYKNQRKIPRYYKQIFILVLLSIPLIAGYPLLTGDLNGKLKPQPVPEEYIQLDQWLENQYTTYFKVVMYPNIPPWGTIIPTIKYNEYWRFSIDSLLNNKTTNFGTLLNPWSVRYIIVRTAPSKSEAELDAILNLFKESRQVITALKNQDDVAFIKNVGSLYVFENLEYSPQITIPNMVIGIDDGLDTINSLSHIGIMNKNFTSVQVLSQSINNFMREFNISNILVFPGSNILFPLNSETKVITPFHATIHHSPAEMWSKAATNDPLHGDWHPYLKNLGMENWQFDYGKGLVFTWALREIPKDLTPKSSDLIAFWNFSNKKEFNDWKNMTPEKQFNAIQELKLDNNSLQVLLWNSTWGWKTIKSPLIEVEPEHVYRFELKIKGYNAHKVHIKIAEFDKNNKYLSTKYITGVGDGTFDWKTVTFDYQPENENTKYLQLQIWHGHETDKPLPNIIWVDDVRVYDITNYTKPVTLEIPFKVDKTDNYKLFIRYFKNQKGGAIRVYLDGTPIYIKTKDQLNKFVWEDLGTFKLEKGEHKIVLENVRGFNAVNLFALVPENEYYNAKEEVGRLLQNKTIIYLFEAESDLYREKAEVIKDFNASNGEAVKFKDKGKAWQNVEIVKNSTYKLALKGAGTFNVSIGNYSYILTLNNLTFKYTPMFYLRNGEYKLKIISLSKNAILDVVWLYSTNNNETLEELFQVKEKPAQVQNCTKINPTLWKVEVNATKPFMLTFAESYDPLWEARVYKDGKLIEKVSPVPVYGVINGFWVNQTGDLEIVLRYTPQDWFERGLIISLTTFILSLSYIFYDWRREKGDKWAKKLEEKFRRIISRVKIKGH